MIFIKPAPSSTTRRTRAAAFGLALLALAPLWTSPQALAQERAQGRLPTTRISAGMHIIDTELAVSPAQQQTGMMFRTEMGANEGMLFVNDDTAVRCFWMRNTLIPLSIAFVSNDGTIVNIADMQPRSEASHCSAKPVRYALEMRQGWFSKRGIAAGTRLRGKPFQE